MIIDDLDGFWCGSAGATERQVRHLEDRFRVVLPKDFRALVRKSNGGLWYTGDRHVRLWSLQQSEAFNSAPKLDPWPHEVLGIAEDLGKGAFYGFDFRKDPIMVVEILPHSQPLSCGPTISECLTRWHYESISRVFFDHIARGGPPGIPELLTRLPTWYVRPGIRGEAIRRIEVGLRITFPRDYGLLLQWANGFDCVAGPQYLRLAAAEDLEPLNLAHQVTRYMPGAVMIGTDGGDRGIAFRYHDPHEAPRLVLCDLGALGFEDAQDCGESLEVCLQDWSGVCRAALSGARHQLLATLWTRATSRPLLQK